MSNRHTASGRWQLGLALALITVTMWSSLAVAMKIALNYIDPVTLTWFRFAVAFVLTALILWPRGLIGPFKGHTTNTWVLLLIAAGGLLGNYVFYVIGLDYTSPANAQVFIQLAPLGLALGGLWIFGEHYTRSQWLGFTLVICGLGLFFTDQLAVFADASDTFYWGAFIMVLAALSWDAYALAQKQLLRLFSSQRILLFIYLASAVALLPFVQFDVFGNLDLFGWLAVGYCAINTLIAYGAFAEALAHWEASRVSTVIAITPLSTFAVVELGYWWRPDLIAAEQIALWGWIGALMVVCGSMLSSGVLKRRRRRG